MIGSRVKQARNLCGLTQAELAKIISAPQQTIAAIEAGRFRPSPEYIERIALKTGFQPGFFERETPAGLPQGSLLYRAHKSVLKKVAKERAHTEAEVALELANFLSARLRRIPVGIPRFRDEPDVGHSAQVTRDALGFSANEPIPNLISALEKKGVLVIVLPTPVEGMDGFSAWAEDRLPVIVLSPGKSAYRMRFTTGEELGHCVLHSPLQVSAADADKEARRFCEELLLPAEAMLAELEPPVTLSTLAALKPRWGASMAFLARRARSLGIITTNQHRYLSAQVRAKSKSYKEEPGDKEAKPERPRLIGKMAEMLYGAPPDLARISRESGIPLRLVRSMIPEAPEAPGRRDHPKVLEFRTRRSG